MKDDIRQFAKGNRAPYSRDVPETVVAAIKAFAEVAEEGDPTPFPRVRDWIQANLNYTIGRQRFTRVVEELGFKAWWK